MVNFTGSGVALITPFTKNNKINYDKIDELIEYHICNNTDFIVVCGTTGESSTLSNTEKKQLISYVCKKCKNKIPVVAGTGSNNTKIALNMSKYAKSQGADGVLVVTPYYNKCNHLTNGCAQSGKHYNMLTLIDNLIDDFKNGGHIYWCLITANSIVEVK